MSENAETTKNATLGRSQDKFGESPTGNIEAAYDNLQNQESVHNNIEAEFTQEEIDAFERIDEEESLSKLSQLVQRSSRHGVLVKSTDLHDLDFIPPHMNGEDFEMFVHGFLTEGEDVEEHIEVEEPKQQRSASKAVGIPTLFTKKEAPDPAEGLDGGTSQNEGAFENEAGEITEGTSQEKPASESVQEVQAPKSNIPEGYELVELEGEMTLIPLEEEDHTVEFSSSNTAIMMGKEKYYLYNKDVMTDTFARWAFLAEEDDRIATFIECVRSESRVYPRPMPAIGLMNEPFSYSTEDIEDIWQIVEQSGEYPDIAKTVASNGAVYFFSTDHLTPAYAASLAEWEAVERGMNL